MGGIFHRTVTKRYSISDICTGSHTLFMAIYNHEAKNTGGAGRLPCPSSPEAWYIKGLKILSLFFFMAFASNVMAEGACPPGQYQIGGQGAIACAPIPQGNSAQQQPVAPRPTGEWIKTWGAISIGSVDSTTIYGVTTGKLSKSDAEKDSLMRCSSRAKDNCKVVFSYRNQCVALAEPQINGLALSAGIIKYVSAGTINEASAEAEKECSQLNQNTPEAKCTVAYTACTAPFFKKILNSR